MLSRREMLAVAGLLAPGAAAAAPDVVNFPFWVTRNRPWTAVHLNGKEPGLPFMLDTGSTSFGILDSKAAELGLIRAGKTQVEGVIGRADAKAYIAGLLVGGAVRYDDTFLFGLTTMFGDLEGLIPLTRFNMMGFDFDTQKAMVARRMPALEGYTPLEVDPGEADHGSLDRLGAFTMSEEYQEFRDHRPVVNAEFDGQPVKLLVDTGADGSLFIYPDTVKARGLWDRYPGWQESGVGSVAGATGKARMVRAERLKLGRIVFAKPLVILGDPADSERDGNRIADGVIGMEFLRRLNFVNDPKRRQLWIKPNKAVGDGYRMDRAGAVVAMQDGAARVIYLRPGSPADRAGLRLDDKVTGWRGRNGVDGLQWAMLGAPGSKVEIQVERDGKPQMVAITLEEPI
jgi:predicted aspartyl protease